MAVRLIFTHLIQMITDIPIKSLFINAIIWIQWKCRCLYFKSVLEISLFQINRDIYMEISVFQLLISVFKNKNRFLYLKHRYIYLKYRYLYFLNAEISYF